VVIQAIPRIERSGETSVFFGTLLQSAGPLLSLHFLALIVTTGLFLGISFVCRLTLET
jgi:hypothetical protein